MDPLLNKIFTKTALFTALILSVIDVFAQDETNCPIQFSGWMARKNPSKEIFDTLTVLSVRFDDSLCASSDRMPDLDFEIPNLVSLGVNSANSFLQLSPDIGMFKTVERLIISDFHGNSLPESIYQLPRLRSLRLNHCDNFQEFPEEFGNFNKLEVLYLNDCKSFKRLPNNIGDLENLKVFKCINSRISDFPDSFKNLDSLYDLHFESSTMTEFPIEIIESQAKYKYIELKLPKLRELPENIGLINFQKQSREYDDYKQGILTLTSCHALEKLPVGLVNARFTLVIEDARNLINLSGLNDAKEPFMVQLYELESRRQLKKMLRSLDDGDNLKLRFSDAKFFKRVPRALYKLDRLQYIEVFGLGELISENHLVKLDTKLQRKLPRTSIKLW